jgi:hypothetical protein
MFLVAILSACTGSPSAVKMRDAASAQEVGYVFVAPLPAIEWSKISSKLAPKNNLSTEQARGLAATTTQSQVKQVIDELAFALHLGLPTIASATTENYSTGAKPTRTRTRTESYGTAAAPDVPESNIQGDSLAANLGTAIANVPVDGGTLLTEGTALFQQAQILDNQISNAYLPKGYRAHLITLQVNLQPKARDYSYDAYTTVTVLPANLGAITARPGSTTTSSPDGYSPVVIYPLVISENMETASGSNSAERVRSVALQLAASVGAIGVGASGRTGSDKLEQLIGSDKNSILTVGRITDNSVQIRIGAQNSSVAGQAMVPRSYHVSLVVLSRWESATNGVRVGDLAFTTHTRFMSAASGVEVPSKFDRNAIVAELDRRASDFGFGPITSSTCNVGNFPKARAADDNGKPLNAGASSPKESPESAFQLPYMETLRAALRSDISTVARCLDIASVEALSPIAQLNLRRFVAAAVELGQSSRYSNFVVMMPEGLPPMKLPIARQKVLFRDDGDQATTMTLRGGSGMRPDSIDAVLCLSGRGHSLCATEDACATQLLPLEAEAINEDGTAVSLKFASVSALAAGVENPLKSPILRMRSKGESNIQCNTYDLLAAGKPKPKTIAKSPLSTTQSLVVASDSGGGLLMIDVGKLEKGISFPITLMITGAHVVGFEPAGGASQSDGSITVAGPGTIGFKLANLASAGVVSITAAAAGEGDSKISMGTPLTVAVDRRPALTH